MHGLGILTTWVNAITSFVISAQLLHITKFQYLK
jgi:hypothetical protein